MKRVVRRHTISFSNAFAGLSWAIATQPNYKTHLTLAFLAVIGSFLFGVSYAEWLVILILIVVGLVIETVNTALEATTDAIDLKKREDIRIAKDCSAAAMLIFALGAFVIAGIIFAPKIFLTLHF